MVVGGRFDPALVALSVVIATAASYTALDLAGRGRASAGRARQAWLGAAAIAMGGGIWSMHFVAMLAFIMPMPVAYDVGLTALSLVVAVLVTGVGFAIVSPAQTGWREITVAGLFMGAGICAMHYIGMAAMEMEAGINYAPLVVAASYLIAAGASIVGLWLAFATKSLSERVAAAIAMGVAISGMHYTGMAAATFETDHAAHGVVGLSTLAQINLALAVSATTFLILFLAVVSSIVDRRLAALSLREAQKLRESEERYRRLYEALQNETTQREHAEAALRQMQKMEAVGQLTGGIAHDFNNILTVVVGNLDAVVRGLAPENELRRRAESALRGALRAADLTRQLLAFGRRQTLAPRRINVNQLVVGLSAMLTRTLGEKIKVETILAGAVWPCVVDPNQLEAALLNLALNARDAMPQGGKLAIQTANMHFDHSYTTRYEGIDPGDYVMLAVSDTGAGIPKEHLRKVFEPFFTTKEIGKGSGLGLAQVYGFVKQSGGHVTVYSEVGTGTTVRVYLRREHVAEEAAKRSAHSEEAPLARSGEQILVVEDDPAVRDFSVETLRELGYGVLAAEDAPAALQLITTHRGIHLMFTDIGLPGMNGRTLAEIVCKRHPAIKILYTTGYAGAALAIDGTLGTDDSVLQKPFTRETLAERIRAVLDGRAMV
jgi:NO-binding membrane sensor protein with MHYT domain/CheY-like chemotaxis protein